MSPGSPRCCPDRRTRGPCRPARRTIAPAIFVDRDVGLVERLPTIKRRRQQGQLVFMLNVRIVANPGAVELSGQSSAVIS